MDLRKGALSYGDWKIFPITPGAKNPPLVKWGKQSTSNKDQITAWWNRMPRANIGFAAGQSGYGVIDVDTKDGRRGLETLEMLELMDGLKLSPTRMQRTPSGGLQYFYKGDIPTSQNIIGKNYWPDGISHIDTRGIGGSGGGYVLLPPSETVEDPSTHTKAGMYEWINDATFPIAPFDDWVLEIFAAQAMLGHNNAPQEFVVEPDTDENIEWFKHHLANDAPIAIEGQGGELRTLTLAGLAKDHGISEEHAFDLIYFSSWNERCEPPWEYDELKTKVANAYSYLKQTAPGAETPEAHFQDDPPPPGPEYKAKSASVEQALRVDHKPNLPPKGQKAIQTTRDDDFADDAVEDDNSDLLSDKPTPTPMKIAAERVRARDAVTKERIWSYPELCDEWVYIAQMDRFVYEANPNIILKTDQFDKLFKYCKPYTEPKQHLNTVSSYMFSRHTLTIRKPMCAVFLPGEPAGMTDDGNYNLFRPSEVVAAEGDTQFWDEHLEYLFPKQQDRDHVLNWCAWLVQNISLKPKHVLLLAGHKHGTGKSFIAYVLRQIIGKHNVTPLTSIELSSSFNKWALGSKMLLIEELDALEKNVIKHTLHPIITEETLTINDKGISTFQADNCFGIFAMTNEDAALRLSNEDRRYLVVRTQALPKPQSYYHELYGILEDKIALGAIAHQLMTRDLGEYNGQARAPDTSAKQEMIISGLNDLEHWMLENAGVWPLNGRILGIDDIIALLPSRLEKTQRLSSTIMSILRHRFQGVPLGQCRIPHSKERISLWAINGSAISKIDGANFGAIYLKDRSERGKNEIKSDFSDDDTSEEEVPQ